ncbi:aldo-keto reductase family 1 member B7 [Ciona intestinalis]
MEIPLIELNNGVKMPMVGLGTSKAKKPNELREAVKVAIDAGYRHFDCAYIYGNEKEVGDGIRDKIEDGTVKREDLFIVSKLWRAYSRPELMDECFNESLRRLGVDYFDLYLEHFPNPTMHGGPGVLELIENGKSVEDLSIDYVTVWKNMQKYLESGKTRALGVSNFNEFQMSRLLRECDVIPAVNQVESHPYLNNDKLVKLCQSRHIAVVAYCPLGSAERINVNTLGPPLLDDPELNRIALRLGKTPAQVALRFNIQRNILVIPKSVTTSRIKENMAIFDFKLTDEDMEVIHGLNRNRRYLTAHYYNLYAHHKFNPFRENYNED